MWVVCKVEDFEFETSFRTPVKIKCGKAIGFLPVYETREDASADFPDTPLTQMEYITQKAVK